MSGAVSHSYESPSRRATRLALGVAVAFVFAQAVAWPLAHFAAVAVVVLLIGNRPLKYTEGWQLFSKSVFNFFLGGTLAWLLSPWPAILAISCGFMLFQFSKYLLTTNAHALILVSALVGFVVVPIIIVLLPPVGFIGALAFSLDWAVALVIAWITWLIMPRTAALPEDHTTDPLAPETVSELAWKLTLILTPLMVAFMAFSWTKILVAAYAVLIATTLSSAAGHQSMKSYLIANGVYAALGMLIVYELLVMVPDVTFLFPLIFIAAYLFGVQMFRGGPTAGYWESGFFGFLIMLGGILMKDDIVAASTLVGRLWQVMLAGVYVIFAFSVLDWVRSFNAREESSQIVGPSTFKPKEESSHD
jgi:hypothetical protein